MLILTYDHKTRTVEKDLDGVKTTISLDEAQRLNDSLLVHDCNLAFHRLVTCDYDPEEVEKEYNVEDSE